ncbi:DMT family transporter [Bifidobacterium biavatii]|uniref:Membrane protein n=1 Tax=Bifidobacterium biavatii DSM 23969 TaxID=1437608 RepID=A0A086ZR09_9BIFI|nr:DMT family transporter [Bifidobacterium biavatii]KFI48959.1 membrane protein [Bifidobacterium biavatii DSM 23969]
MQQRREQGAAVKVSPSLARLMLVVNAAVWGSGYTILKHVQQTIPTQWMMVLRMGAAAIILGIVFLPHLRRIGLRRYVIPGILLALSFWLGYIFQLWGLSLTAPGRNAFLTDTYCVMVPFLIWALTKRRPTWQHIIATFVCVVGIGFVSLSGGGGADLFRISFGDGITIVGAFFFALNLVTVGMLGRRYDATGLMFSEFAFTALLFLIGAVPTEGAPQAGWLRWDLIAGLAYLVIGSTIIAQLFQTIAVQHLPTAQASIILSTESVFGVLVSVLFYGEILTAQSVTGFALIFCAIILSEVALPSPFRRRRKNGERAGDDAAKDDAVKATNEDKDKEAAVKEAAHGPDRQ